MSRSRRPSAALVVASLSLVVSCTGVAAAATGNLVLGANNQATGTTTLKTPVSVGGATLKLKNSGTGPAASFVTQAGRAPFKVSGSTKVTGLNVDLLDSLDSSAFRKVSDPVDATSLDGLDASAFRKVADAVDAGTLDGLDSSAFRKVADAVDAGTLDGLDSSAFRKVADAVDAGTLDGLDSTSFLRGDTTPRMAMVMRLTAESTASAQATVLTSDYEFYDPSDMRTNAQPARLVAPVAGTYIATACVDWDPNGTGYRRVSVVNDSVGTFGSVAGPPLASPAYTSQCATGIVHLAAGDFVRIEVLQGSGAALAVRTARFSMAYIGA